MSACGLTVCSCKTMNNFAILQLLNFPPNQYLISPQVETVGDAYLLVGGLPTKDDNHAKYAANIAIEMVQKIQQVNNQSELFI